MLVNLIFLLIISSGSIFCTVKFEKKYEEILPVTCLGYTLILFLSGILGNLIYGFYFVLIVSAFMYAGCFILLVNQIHKDRQYLKKVIRNIITPGFCFFFMFYLCSSLVLRGLLAHSWDEFSHWIDIVKVMTQLDDFGTNPLSHSAFKTYPPLMSLFQYMMQKVFLLIHPEAGFMEWRCHFAWQILSVSVFLPLFSKIERGRIIETLSLAGIILLVPPVFYYTVYSTAYIDPFLAVLTGSGFSAVIVWGKNCKRSIFYSFYIWLVIAALVLAKDAGMLFAVVLAFLYISDYLICTGWSISSKNKWDMHHLLHIVMSAASVAVPKILWNYELSSSGLESASGEIRMDYAVLLDIILGRNGSYQSQVIRNYIQALFEPYVSFGHTGISFNYISLMALEILFFYIALRHAVKDKAVKKSQAVLYMSLFIFQLMAFIIGMCVTYMFNFSEYEAVRLASFSRYENIVFLASSIAVLVLLWKLIFCRDCHRKTLQAVFLSVILLAMPGKELAKDVLRINYRNALQVRQEYVEITDNITNLCKEGSAVYIISQATTGFDKWVLKFNIRPNTINEDFGSWSIGDGPFYDGDIWTVQKSCKEWKEELLSSYDYVALYRVNDYFRSTYGKLFKEPGAIQDNSLFRVNKDKGYLERVGHVE